jgi:hypothetical protein
MGHRYKPRGRVANAPPTDERWLWHPHSLLESSSWRTRSLHCRKLIEFLELEHIRHGAVENGRLLAPYSQLEKAGIGRRYIFNAIREAESRGLVRVDRGGRKGTVMVEVSRFRLTYYWQRFRANDTWDWRPPTDEWRDFGEL